MLGTLRYDATVVRARYCSDKRNDVFITLVLEHSTVTIAKVNQKSRSTSSVFPR